MNLQSMNRPRIVEITFDFPQPFSDSQAECRGFDSHRPLQCFQTVTPLIRRRTTAMGTPWVRETAWTATRRLRVLRPIDIGCLGPDFIRKLLDGLGAARIGDTHAVALLAPSASDSSPNLANADFSPKTEEQPCLSLVAGDRCDVDGGNNVRSIRLSRAIPFEVSA
jgi:hypothetical protein